MPHKRNAARCHNIGKMKFKVANWREYKAGFRRRGGLTLWLTPQALDGWTAPRRKHAVASNGIRIWQLRRP